VELFLFKKFISVAIMPINIALFFLLVALFKYSSRSNTSLYSILIAITILVVSSMPPISNHFVHGFEQTYEPFSRSVKPVDYIVILGCGHQTNDAIPVTSQLKACSLQRLVEGIRVSKLHPEAQIITSGFSTKDPVPNAVKVKQAAVLLGVPEHKIITESYPRDTKEEAELIAPRVRGTNVVLVTDAYHLARAMNYFEQEGVKPIPAPAGYYVKDINGETNWLYYLPSSKNLHQTSIAWYETMGRVWQWVAN
jgi:uncharacterized SAM-binding protein YcdF (DUF218 family)